MVFALKFIYRAVNVFQKTLCLIFLRHLNRNSRIMEKALRMEQVKVMRFYKSDSVLIFFVKGLRLVEQYVPGLEH